MLIFRGVGRLAFFHKHNQSTIDPRNKVAHVAGLKLGGNIFDHHHVGRFVLRFFGRIFCVRRIRDRKRLHFFGFQTAGLFQSKLQRLARFQSVAHGLGGFAALGHRHFARTIVFDLIDNLLFRLIQRERARLHNPGEMQNCETIGGLKWIAVRFLLGQFKRGLIQLRICFQLCIRRRHGEFSGCFHRQLKLVRDLAEIAFVQQRLRNIIRAIGQLLEHVDPLLVFQFFLLVA